MSWKTEDFWQFSCRNYPLHKPDFLYLQDQYQLNVNLCLLALFLDQHKASIHQVDWQKLMTAINESEQQINQFRAQRRMAKVQQSPNYSMLLQQELSLEKMQQEIIINRVNRLETTTTISTSNLYHYCYARGLIIDQTIKRLLDKLTQ